ncbi:MAG: signal peptidase II [Candidatus Limnocylindria bacterium]
MAERATRQTSRWTWLVLGLAAAVVYVVDQASKALVAGSLDIGARAPVVGNFLVLTHARNRGAAFSLLQGETVLFVAVTLFALGMIVFFHRALRDRGLWLHAVLGLQLGGALGNLTDRLRQGYVVDFVSAGIGDLRWPTFNVADASLVVGIGVLVVYLLRTPERREPALA